MDGAACPGSQRLVSSDGTVWSARRTPEANYWTAVAYGEGRFVAVGRNSINASVMTGDFNGGGCTDPTAEAGFIFYSDDHRVMQWCDGYQWAGLGPVNPTGLNDGCEDPIHDGGTVIFNQDHCVLQYCDGDTWRGIGPLASAACNP